MFSKQLKIFQLRSRILTSLEKKYKDRNKLKSHGISNQTAFQAYRVVLD